MLDVVIKGFVIITDYYTCLRSFRMDVARTELLKLILQIRWHWRDFVNWLGSITTKRIDFEAVKSI